MGPEFSQVVEGVYELTAQNPFSPIFITVFYCPFGKLLPPHLRVLMLQQHKLIPSLDKRGAHDPDLASPNLTPPNCVIAPKMGMWSKSSQSGPIQASHRIFVWVVIKLLSPGLLKLNPERYKAGLLINSILRDESTIEYTPLPHLIEIIGQGTGIGEEKRRYG